MRRLAILAAIIALAWVSAAHADRSVDSGLAPIVVVNDADHDGIVGVGESYSLIGSGFSPDTAILLHAADPTCCVNYSTQTDVNGVFTFTSTALKAGRYRIEVYEFQERVSGAVIQSVLVKQETIRFTVQ